MLFIVYLNIYVLGTWDFILYVWKSTSGKNTSHSREYELGLQRKRLLLLQAAQKHFSSCVHVYLFTLTIKHVAPPTFINGPFYRELKHKS